MNLKSIFFSALALTAFASCSKSDEPDPADPKGDFVIEQQYLSHVVGRESSTIEIPVATTLSNAKWYISTAESWLFVTKKGPTDGKGTVSISVLENKSGAIRSGSVKISTSSIDYTVTVKQYADNDLHPAEDFRIVPRRATATNYQVSPDPGPIELSYDNDENTMFHSKWSANGPFPFTMTYFFDGNEEINYIDYVPRKGGGNGVFQEFEVHVAKDASGSSFEKIGDYTHSGSAATKRITLPDGLKPTAVKFIVNKAVANVVSCAEMRFMRYNPDDVLTAKLLGVFTDVTCSQLKPGVTMADIETLDPAFQRIGEALLTNTYDPMEKSFRIHEYSAYSDPTVWSQRLMTKIYSNWDNPMGIAVKKGEPCLILVGNTYGNSLQVQILGEQGNAAAKTQRPQNQGTFHLLREGVNVITPDQDGQLFLMYTATPAASKPIKVHVPLGYGTFAGYFSLKEHKTDEMYSQIMAKAQDKYFCVVGDRMLLYFKRSVLPKKIVDPITQWDNIITWQQNFMGIDDVRPAQWNNHVAGISMGSECGYMWASDYCMGFEESSIDKLMGLDHLNANADNAWGPAHEMGHINQKAINWASTTESSNNLFSNYVLYRFNRYSSRGSGLYYRFTAVYEMNQSWASMSSNANGPEPPAGYDEDTAIHMRMNWQLWNYYHRVLGDDKFFGRVFKIMRDLGIQEGEDCGRKQLEFAVACSEAAGEDLTDFFEAWGFFKPHAGSISQYGTFTYSVKAAAIADAKARMAKFPKPKHALEYIEDRDGDTSTKPGDWKRDKIGNLGYYTAYEQNLKVSANASATVSGSTVTAKNCENAVAIEIRVKKGDSYGEIRYASNYTTFTIPSRIATSGCAIYAVQADGTRLPLATL